jgi:ribosome-associated heat shock protein Hsp15
MTATHIGIIRCEAVHYNARPSSQQIVFALSIDYSGCRGYTLKMKNTPSVDTQETMRLDKWLWAARFFKTRSLASDAIQGGKVHLNHSAVKPGKEVRPGMLLTIRRGHSVMDIEIKKLCKQRRPASEAAELYEETEQSRILREQQTERFKLDALARPQSEGRPDKRGRRKIQAFKHHVE